MFSFNVWLRLLHTVKKIPFQSKEEVKWEQSWRIIKDHVREVCLGMFHVYMTYLSVELPTGDPSQWLTMQSCVDLQLRLEIVWPDIDEVDVRGQKTLFEC